MELKGTIHIQSPPSAVINWTGIAALFKKTKSLLGQLITKFRGYFGETARVYYSDSSRPSKGDRFLIS